MRKQAERQAAKAAAQAKATQMRAARKAQQPVQVCAAPPRQAPRARVPLAPAGGNAREPMRMPPPPPPKRARSCRDCRGTNHIADKGCICPLKRLRD